MRITGGVSGNWSESDEHRAIANELSLGLESLVFLDDNPAERRLVRDVLPRSRAGTDRGSAFYVRTLLAAGYFEAVMFSSEDLNAPPSIRTMRAARS